MYVGAVMPDFGDRKPVARPGTPLKTPYQSAPYGPPPEEEKKGLPGWLIGLGVAGGVVLFGGALMKKRR